MKARLVPLASLQEDRDVYPRHSVDMSHVRSLSLALEAGESLPPIVVDKATMRVADGWHRVRAHRAVYGDDASIEAELREYANEAAFVVDSIKLNARHGRRLDRVDQVRSVLLLEKLGVPSATIASTMSIPEQRVVRLQARVAYHEGAAVPLKGSHLRFKGQEVSGEQVAAMRRGPGVSYGFLAQQLAEGLEAGLVDDDDKTDARLRRLFGALGERLGAEAL